MLRASHSIRSQLLIMAVGLLAVISAITYVMAKDYGLRAAQISFDRLLAGAALQIAEDTNVSAGQIIVDLPISAFETLSLAPDDRVFYRITDSNNLLLTGYDDLPRNVHLENKVIDTAKNQSPTPAYFDAEYSGEPVRFMLLAKLITEEAYTGEVLVQLGHTLKARGEMAEEISWRAIQLIIPFFLIGLVLVMLGIWQLLRPIRRLNNAIAHRSPSDLSALQLPVPKEVEPLVGSINHFMNQLGTTLDRLKRFTSEAAHQIKTPLAGLKSQAQNALDEQDQNVRREQLNRVVESCDMLNSTVTQLLDQAILAHRFQSEPLRPVRLDTLTKQVCRDVAVSALQQGVEVAYSGDQEITINGDEFALQQMLRNVLENAIKYSPKESSVEIELGMDSTPLYEQIWLHIKDQGIGIPDEEKAHVFERFYRSPNNPRSGTGLGLAIAREVAAHHNATLKLLDNEPHGLIVQFTFRDYRG